MESKSTHSDIGCENRSQPSSCTDRKMAQWKAVPTRESPESRKRHLLSHPKQAIASYTLIPFSVLEAKWLLSSCAAQGSESCLCSRDSPALGCAHRFPWDRSWRQGPGLRSPSWPVQFPVACFKDGKPAEPFLCLLGCLETRRRRRLRFLSGDSWFTKALSTAHMLLYTRPLTRKSEMMLLFTLDMLSAPLSCIKLSRRRMILRRLDDLLDDSALLTIGSRLMVLCFTQMAD